MQLKRTQIAFYVCDAYFQHSKQIGGLRRMELHVQERYDTHTHDVSLASISRSRR
jgi:hypothetical protein